MKEVKHIHPPNPDLIGRLESLLSEAKSGELQGLAYAGRIKSSYTCSGWVGYDTGVMSTLGELRVLERDMIDLLVDIRVDPMTGQER